MQDLEFFPHERLQCPFQFILRPLFFAPCSLLSDHPICPRQHVRRNGEFDLLGGRQIEAQATAAKYVGTVCSGKKDKRRGVTYLLWLTSWFVLYAGDICKVRILAP